MKFNPSRTARHAVPAAALLAFSITAPAALAMDHAAHAPAAAAASGPTAPAPWTLGELRKIDAAGGKITLKHEEIAHLDMPPMTMVFRLRDARLLEGRKVGERLRFRVEMQAGGLVVTALELAP
ncbi:copper-binding protein [Kinneretia aquatilis]|jgi:Cu/Ag efflux protein CusF|uniref:copper-binding protein n=1 Tax=Kinneretia aquatilis TaxID=2070761 RepID=UPI001CBB07B6|nr:copper-binding protein [Paucibacter aquatile]WIV97217.1 copper-binding protein [Paucibacter aquatile]